RIAQRQPILRLVHPETARPTGASREEDVVVENLLTRLAFLLKSLQKLHQIADREVGGIALAVVAVFFASLKSRYVRDRKRATFISQSFKRPMDQLFMFPGETAEQKRGVCPLALREWVFDRSFEVAPVMRLNPHLTRQSDALFFELLSYQFLLRAYIN